MTAIQKLNDEISTLVRDLTEEQVLIVQKKITLDAFSGFVKRTPVDKGVARAGWQIGIATPPALLPNPKPGANTEAQTAKVAEVKGLGTIFITNDVPYIGVLDRGGFIPTDPGPSKDKREGRKGRILVKGGFSVQAPNGMVDVTLNELAQELSSGS